MKPTYEELQSQLTALTSQLESVVAECSGLRHLLYKIGETGNANFGRTSLPTPATSAFLAEVRASGADECVRQLVISDDDDFSDAPNVCAMVAHQLRHGGAV